jgi:hypothetical protein
MSTQEQAIVKAEPKPEAQSGKLSRIAAFTPTNLTEAIALSKLIAGSELAPKDFKGKPANCLIAMQMGAEVGLAPMQALQNIAVISGRPSLWGDAALGVVQVHPDYEWHKEFKEGVGETRQAVFQIKRRGHEMYQVVFSVADAKKALLWGKQGPWQTSPDRMLQMRARGFGLRDKFADALRGLSIAEEVMDIAPDTSDVKKKREEGTLDVGASISDLAPSSEPNRGHGNEGMRRVADQPDPKPDNVMCSDCGVVNGHEASCKHAVKAEQDAKTSKPTKKAAFQILAVDLRHKKANNEPYLVMDVVDPANHQGKLYVWHQSLHEYLMKAVDKPILCEISEQKKGESTYYQLEHLLEISGQTFVDNKPAQQATMPAQEEPF